MCLKAAQIVSITLYNIILTRRVSGVLLLDMTTQILPDFYENYNSIT